MRSVEFDIAELSPAGEGVGYAMPASGGSPPSTMPSCVFQVNPDSVSTGDTVAYAFVHGTDKNTSREDFDPNVTEQIKNILDKVAVVDPAVVGSPDYEQPSLLTALMPVVFAGGGPKINKSVVIPSLRGVLNGVGSWVPTKTCLAYCDLDTNRCDTSSATGWKPMNLNDQKLAFADDSSEGTSLAMLAREAEASGGSSAYCGEFGIGTLSADHYWGSGRFAANSQGHLVLGMIVLYAATYGGHHDVGAYNYCSDTLNVSASDAPELIPQVLTGGTYARGSDINLSALVQNIGMAKTAQKNGEDGKFNYVMRLDVNNDGFAAGQNGDRRFASAAGAVGPLGLKGNNNDSATISQTWPAASVVTGTHKLTVCVDTDNKVTEINENNNCASATFTVKDPNLMAVPPASVPIYGVYNEPTTLYGFVMSTGDVQTTESFSNLFEISGGSQTKTVTVGPDTMQNTIIKQVASDVNLDSAITNWKYRLWVDSNDDVIESSDNVRPNTSGDNDTDWINITLVPAAINVSPRDRNGGGTGNGYWGPFLYTADKQVAFNVNNVTLHGLNIETPFDAIIAIDQNGDCGDSVSYTDACVDYTVRTQVNGVLAGTPAQVVATWPADVSQVVTTAYARIYADVNRSLEGELDRADNISEWVPFSIVDSLPGEDVDLIPDKTSVRTGEQVTFTWNLNGRDAGSCHILKNDVEEIANSLEGLSELKVTVSATADFTLECGATDATQAARDTETITALSSYYET